MGLSRSVVMIVITRGLDRARSASRLGAVREQHRSSSCACGAPAATHTELAKRLAELVEKTEALAIQHDTFSRSTRIQLKQGFDALRELMTPPDPPKRPIGFVTHEDKGKKGQAKHRA